MTSKEHAGPASDPIERAVAHDSIRLSDLLTAANARNKEHVADLELLSIEKGQLKERIAALEAEKALLREQLDYAVGPMRDAAERTAVALAVEECVRWLGDNGYPLKALHMQRALSPTIAKEII